MGPPDMRWGGHVPPVPPPGCATVICTNDVIELCGNQVLKEQQTKIHRRKSESGPPSKIRDGTILGR